MSMGFMVAAASRSKKMENEGREMENRQQEGNYGRAEGYDRMENVGAEMRRRRDSRGRYMEDGGQMEMGYGRMEGGQMNQGNYNRMEGGGGGNMAYRPWPEPHVPPYLDRPESRRMESAAGRPSEMMDGQNPYGEEPEVYRKQRESEMRRMAESKTSGGEINYNRPDGGYGNVRYFMHKTDPMNQRGGEEQFEQPRQIGFQSRETKELDKQTVMGWVEEMEDSDGVKGGKYTWHQAQQYAMNMGITGQQRMVEFYWAMNAMYSDYSKAAKKFGVDKPEFYACLAKEFLEDPDAVDNKVESYYNHVVKHG